MVVEQNISRLEYLLNQYRLSIDSFLELISNGLKKKIKKDEIFTSHIKINHLKRIDKIFNKGLSYYLDSVDPGVNKESSIFFRKIEFNTELNLKAKQIVSEFEDFKLSISAIAKLSNQSQERFLPTLTLKDNSRENAIKFREKIYPSFITDRRKFLKALINRFAIQNILVFEFVETWNQKERANIDGVYLNPNVIVLKRHEGQSYRREIFTLLHELGHYLLNIEEIEKIEYDSLANKNLGAIETWCNEFAFHFLINNYEGDFYSLPFCDVSNDYNHGAINIISHNTHLSEIALYTRLLFVGKISYYDYSKIKKENEEGRKRYYDELKKSRVATKNQKGSPPRPIKSDLLISTVQTAYYEGVIDEYEVCKTLKITPDKFGIYIQ